MLYADYKKQNPIGSVPQNVSQNSSDPSNLQGAIRRRLKKMSGGPPNGTPRIMRNTGGPTKPATVITPNSPAQRDRPMAP